MDCFNGKAFLVSYTAYCDGRADEDSDVFYARTAKAAEKIAREEIADRYPENARIVIDMVEED